MKTTRLLLCLVLLGTLDLRADEKPATPPPAAPKHWLIVLKLVPRLHDEKAWSKEDYATVGAHFARLKAGVETGEVILAGRTEEPLNVTQGLIIFAAPDEAAARAFMQGDPCVARGVMTGELHPYGLALLAPGKK